MAKSAAQLLYGPVLVQGTTKNVTFQHMTTATSALGKMRQLATTLIGFEDAVQVKIRKTEISLEAVSGCRKNKNCPTGYVCDKHICIKPKTTTKTPFTTAATTTTFSAPTTVTATSSTALTSTMTTSTTSTRTSSVLPSTQTTDKTTTLPSKTTTSTTMTTPITTSDPDYEQPNSKPILAVGVIYIISIIGALLWSLLPPATPSSPQPTPAEAASTPPAGPYVQSELTTIGNAVSALKRKRHPDSENIFSFIIGHLMYGNITREQLKQIAVKMDGRVHGIFIENQRLNINLSETFKLMEKAWNISDHLEYRKKIIVLLEDDHVRLHYLAHQISNHNFKVEIVDVMAKAKLSDEFLMPFTDSLTTEDGTANLRKVAIEIGFEVYDEWLKQTKKSGEPLSLASVFLDFMRVAWYKQELFRKENLSARNRMKEVLKNCEILQFLY